MKSIRSILTLGIVLLAVSLPLGRAKADLGPKPTVEFAFEQGFVGDPVTIVSGVLLQCDTPDCQDAQPLAKNMGPQGFGCEGLTCSGLAYGFTDYGQLKITFSDGKVRQSNVFAIDTFNAVYDVTIHETDLTVKERFDPAGLYLVLLCLCCCCTVIVVVIVIIVAIIFFARRKAIV